jgi:hypothetical protein
MLRTQRAELREQTKTIATMKSNFKTRSAERKEKYAKQIAKLKISIDTLRVELEERNNQLQELKLNTSLKQNY